MMSNPTPGPWKIAAHCSTLIFDTKGRSIASAGGYQSNTESTIDENEANANLIVAAPDLLEALEGILQDYTQLIDSGDCGNWDSNGEPSVIAAREVISKAKGE